MIDKEKILLSSAIIRFQDCDPYQHLNNANYLHYLINAREDQVKKYYGIDVYGLAKEKGVSWMVTQNQIAYMRPAIMMESVNIASQLIAFTERTVMVEMRMLNQPGTELKAFLWSVFIYVNLRNNSSEKHPEEMMALFREVCVPVQEKIFEDRVGVLRVKTEAVSSKM